MNQRYYRAEELSNYLILLIPWDLWWQPFVTSIGSYQLKLLPIFGYASRVTLFLYYHF